MSIRISGATLDSNLSISRKVDVQSSVIFLVEKLPSSQQDGLENGRGSILVKERVRRIVTELFFATKMDK